MYVKTKGISPRNTDETTNIRIVVRMIHRNVSILLISVLFLSNIVQLSARLNFFFLFLAFSSSMTKRKKNQTLANIFLTNIYLSSKAFNEDITYFYHVRSKKNVWRTINWGSRRGKGRHFLECWINRQEEDDRETISEPQQGRKEKKRNKNKNKKKRNKPNKKKY